MEDRICQGQALLSGCPPYFNRVNPGICMFVVLLFLPSVITLKQNIYSLLYLNRAQGIVVYFIVHTLSLGLLKLNI